MQLYDEYQPFLDRVFTNLSTTPIDISQYQIDHIAYRTQSLEDYQKLTSDLKKIGTSLEETVIRNRPVSNIKLNIPLRYKQYTIPIVEILAPAEGDNYNNVLEHIEVVVGDLQKFMAKYPFVDFITKAISREINPELILKFPDDANVKFHSKPIDQVIELQKQSGKL
ncbi:hypothetical protein A2634_00510 [Candidatus Amesbacteria bacterium RIFCSPHIGHO2_01_FULL_48_32]|uniref:VOC domain-containing protein n=1 Tax=Candidatus Amesbacteria bacterium RIFCSPLOWO2_01_FULL_48_25 TaxID=1797259 RepID=A0A1F4ZAM6_9BACT|nr:MAG: hypothetical protein A2634_00510 [Candidatus Amesbacteria bacterium RIFCSPHIGHO2_01_FULL_48_32]OGD03288.1 MAG: hypothetical protein A2989_00460 [Candidatus Amesbacteria bacterium RIFCSPLOWO2_01_FULL_48_25]HJZ05237.1 VOC family protein [Patescibacteria group bacterium]